MRVREWEKVNARALLSVNHRGQTVELMYQPDAENEVLLQELEGLVMAEQDCCGAAGVKFELLRSQSGIRVQVKVVREGLPSQTVIAAFAAMAPS